MNLFKLKTKATKTKQVNINVQFKTLQLVTLDRNIDFSFSCNNDSNIIKDNPIMSTSTFLRRQAPWVNLT